MYGFPQDLDLNILVGTHIPQLRFGIGDVQVIFSSNVTLCVQGEIDVLFDGEVISSWKQESLWSSLAFQKLYNKDVRNVGFLNDRILEIQLDDNLCIRIYDNSDHYESLQIWFPDGTEVIV